MNYPPRSSAWSPTSPSSQPSPSQLHCRKCQREFSSAKKTLQHVADTHRLAGSGPWRCFESNCNRSFNSDKDLCSCSGRKLSDETSNWSTDLATAVTTTTTDGIYGTCDANGSEVDGSGNLAWKSGKVQVYYCNHGFTPNPCSVNEYWRADDLINDKCGSDGGGWVKIPDWGKTIGRDPTNSDGSFRSECGASLHGVKANVVTNSTST